MIEFAVVVLSAILIVGCVYEASRYLLRFLEDKREEERVEAWRRRQDRK